ncbi:transposable element Tcb2 transposase [Trichonephila clavipes]|uniref:Transposable element Tcb2 transposase n=1 Tax=Trichonephila clavipes TaxID=2585209 RepID=A0A8X6RIQ3_TRICX|nr:transposable element Tcb2 transposase [Trichonephila clavipes]
MVNNQSVGRHLDAFTRGRIIEKLEEGRSVTSVAAEFGIAHIIVHNFGDNFKLHEQLSGSSVGVVHKEPHPQMTRTLSYRPEETDGKQREKSLDTRQRRLDDRYRVLPWPEDCTVMVFLHDTLYDESRFSLSSDYHRILIWREQGSRNHPPNYIEKDRYGGRGVLVWGGIILGSRTDLHIFDAGSVNGSRYCNEILLPYVRLFRGAMGLQFLFLDDNAPCHHTVATEQHLESEDIERIDWPARSPDFNPIEHVWDFLGRRLAARTLPPVTIRELRLALQDEWAAMPQQLIDTLILSMGRRCETCLAVRFGHNSANTIDIALIKNFYYLFTIGSIDDLSSDRNPVFLNFNFKLAVEPPNPRAVSTDWTDFKTNLNKNLSLYDFHPNSINSTNDLEQKIT